MMDSSLNSKMADYDRLRERNARHSRDINRLWTEVDYLKRQQDELRSGLTPRDGEPDTHRGMGTERRPEMIYFPGGDGSPKPPQDRKEDSEDRKPTDDYGTDRPQGSPRRPGMYYLDLDKDASPRDDKDFTRDPVGRQDEPVYVERRPDMYWAGARYDYSPRKEKQYDIEELRKRDRENKYSFFDTTTINPQNWKEKERGYRYPWEDKWKQASPGGLAFIRFRDDGFERAKIAIQKMQSVMRTSGGYLMGMCHKDRINVYETAASKEMCWVPSRQQDSTEYMRTNDALILLWFTSRDAADAFFECRHENRFKECSFPEPDGHESFYCPLVVAPSAKPMDTFLILEIMNGRYTPREDFTQFESELEREMLKIIPTCLPIVSSSVTGRKYFRPGNMISPNSKCIISRFESQRQVDELWRSHVIQDLLQRHGKQGQANVVSFTISNYR